MSKHKIFSDNLHHNFSLKGSASIRIGFCIVLGTYFLDTLFNNFLTEDSLLTNLSIEIIEMIATLIVFSVFIAVTLLLFYQGKRKATKEGFPLWNAPTKVMALQYGIGVIVLLTTIVLLNKLALVNYINPTALFMYGVLVLILRNKKNRRLLLLAGISFIFSFICFLHPSFWYTSLTCLSMAHISYGLFTKK